MFVWLFNFLIWVGVIFGGSFLITSGIVPVTTGVGITVVITGFVTTFLETFRKVK